MRIWRKFACLFVLLCFTSIAAQVVTAQNDVCSATVQQALAEVDQGCAETGRNQACYGYVALEATAREGAQNFSFTQQGDLANVGDIDTLRLSALDLENDQWGIALLKLQANLPDTLPGQNVTFLLFGDVELTNAVAPADPDAEAAEPVTLAATSTGGANVRSEPSTNGAIAGGLATSESVIVNGRNSDNSWLRIEIPDSDDQGWVSASLLTVDGDVSTLDVVEGADAVEAFTPMQAFYFRTGITDTTCAEAPPDGILIQTPEGAGKINLRANDVDVELGSTGFFQAVPDEEMTISVVEGEGSVTSNGVTVTVPAGTQVTVPIDENLQPVGEPSEAQPYDPSLVENLPVSSLPEPIAIAPPLEATQVPPSPGGDAFGGMNMQMFCMMMQQQLAMEGMSQEEVMQQMREGMAQLAAAGYAFPEGTLDDMNQFMAMMEQCQ